MISVDSISQQSSITVNVDTETCSRDADTVRVYPDKEYGENRSVSGGIILRELSPSSRELSSEPKSSRVSRDASEGASSHRSTSSDGRLVFVSRDYNITGSTTTPVSPGLSARRPADVKRRNSARLTTAMSPLPSIDTVHSPEEIQQGLLSPSYGSSFVPENLARSYLPSLSTAMGTEDRTDVAWREDAQVRSQMFDMKVGVVQNKIDLRNVEKSKLRQGGYLDCVSYDHSSERKPSGRPISSGPSLATYSTLQQQCSISTERYFGDVAKKDFFDRCHHVSRKRQSINKGDDEMIGRAVNATTSIRQALDFPFAPRRNDGDKEDYEEMECSVLLNECYSVSQTGMSVDDWSLASTLDLSTIGESIVEKNQSVSPRTKFINGCLREDVNPRASLILRRHVSSNLDLQHRGMGDKFGVLFAESLRELPMVHSINLMDNNLTDASLNPIVQAIISIPTVTSVNLSQNKIDGHGAKALAAYLSTSCCPLQTLIMRSADIDDSEAHMFVAALSHNTSLQELDMSHNIIGRSENLNTVKPAFTTGGEALGELLELNTCWLKTLKLSWNMIRLDGAIAIATALAVNEHLTYLDLSFNSLGQKGGELLGRSLISNSTIQTLLLSNNNITSSACFCICVGIEENSSLRRVVLDGNPVGESGAKILSQIPLMAGSRVELTASRCNIEVKYDKDQVFNISSPSNFYVLDMTDPYERAVAFKLLRIVASQPTYTFSQFAASSLPPSGARNRYGTRTTQNSCRFQPIPDSATTINLARTLVEIDWSDFDDEMRATLASLMKLEAAAKDRDLAKHLFEKFDDDNSGSLDSKEIHSLLTTLGVCVTENDVLQAISMFDVDGTGALEWLEFQDFLRAKEEEASARIKDLTEYPVIVEDCGERKAKYIPPTSGYLYISVTDIYRAGSRKVLSAYNHTRIMDFVQKGIENVTKMLSFGVASTRLREKEALSIHKTILAELRDPVAAAIHVLPNIADPTDARSFVFRVFGYDKVDIRRLKLGLGNSLGPILGIYNGYYYLDLSLENDRQCLRRLLEQSQAKMKVCIEQSIFDKGITGDRSQLGDWSSFRNTVFNGIQTQLTTDMFSPMPKGGTLSFDFCGSFHPPRNTAIMQDSRCINILSNLNLIEMSEKSSVLESLVELKRKTARDIVGDGRFRGVNDKQRAEDIQLCMLMFYRMIPRREKQHFKAIRNESVDPNMLANESPTVYAVDSDYSDSDSDTDIFSDDDNLPSNTRPEDSNVRSFGRRYSTLLQQQRSDISSNSGLNHDFPTDGRNIIPVDVSDSDIPTERPLRKTAIVSSSEYVFDLNQDFRKLKAADVKDNIRLLHTVKAVSDILNRVWIRARHVAVILKHFADGMAPRTKYFGSYRVELVVQLYARIIDIHNFDLILEVLTATEAACTTCRLGILNIWSPMKPEGCYCLDIKQREEKLVAKILALMSIIEPGLNWIAPSFRWEYNRPEIPGWVLTQSWMSDSTMPHRGFLYVEYYSGEGKGLHGCAPNISLRKSFFHLVAITEDDIICDDNNVTENGSRIHDEAVGVEVAYSRQEQWMKLLSPPDSTSARIARGESVEKVFLDEQKRALASSAPRDTVDPHNSVDTEEDSMGGGVEIASATIRRSKSGLGDSLPSRKKNDNTYKPDKSGPPEKSGPPQTKKQSYTIK